MLSLRLWRAVQVAPTNLYVALLHLRQERQPNTRRYSPLSILLLGVMVCGVLNFPPLIFPLALHLYCVSLALTITDGIVRTMRFGKRELVAITPMGEFTMLLDICRVCLDHYRDKMALERDKKIARVVTRLSGFTFILLMLASVTNEGATFRGITIAFTVISALVLVLYLEYRQSFALAMLLSIHAAISGSRLSARLVVVVSYAVIQCALYAPLMLVPTLTDFLTLYVTNLDREMAFVLAGPLLVSVLYTVREGIIFVLWYWLRQRINDDVTAPTL